MPQTVKSILEARYDLEDKFILDFEELGKLIERIRAAGFTIVVLKERAT